MRAWRAGNVAIANAPGAGVADDKVVYAWVPDIIRYYLGEEPLIPNVPTYRCVYPDERAVRDRPHRGAGRQAGQRERRLRPADRRPGDAQRARRAHRADRGRPAELGRPADPVAVAPCRRCATARSSRATSTCARSSSAALASYVTAGGLTRVALRKGSLVVNSSQGGGSKDTWIVETPDAGRIASAVVMLLSRVADNLFWGARYLERARGHRADRAHLHRARRRPARRACTSSWEPLLAIAGSRVDFDAGHARADESRHRPLPRRRDDEPEQHHAQRGARPREPAHDARGAAARGVAGGQRPVPLRRAQRVGGVDRRSRGRASSAASSPTRSSSTGIMTQLDEPRRGATSCGGSGSRSSAPT